MFDEILFTLYIVCITAWLFRLESLLRKIQRSISRPIVIYLRPSKSSMETWVAPNDKEV